MQFPYSPLAAHSIESGLTKWAENMFLDQCTLSFFFKSPFYSIGYIHLNSFIYIFFTNCIFTFLESSIFVHFYHYNPIAVERMLRNFEWPDRIYLFCTPTKVCPPIKYLNVDVAKADRGKMILSDKFFMKTKLCRTQTNLQIWYS